MTSPYTLHTEHRFKVAGIPLAITDFSHDWVEIEEVRKNGQEDCHMSGEAALTTEGWHWLGENFSGYESPVFAAHILKFLDQNGLPEKREPAMKSPSSKPAQSHL